MSNVVFRHTVEEIAAQMPLADTHTQQFWEYMSLCSVHIQQIYTDLTYLPLACYPRIALNLFPGQLLDEMRHEEVLVAAWIYQEVSLVSYRIQCLHAMKCGFLDHFNSSPVFSSLPNTGSTSTLFPFNAAQTLPACCPADTSMDL